MKIQFNKGKSNISAIGKKIGDVKNVTNHKSGEKGDISDTV